MAPAEAPQPLDRSGAGVRVVGVLSYRDGGVEVRSRVVEVVESGEGIADMDADPDIVGPAGQVRLDAGPGLIGQPGLGQGDRDIAVQHGLQIGIDPGQGISDGYGLDAETGAAQVQDEVEQPIRQLADRLRDL